MSQNSHPLADLLKMVAFRPREAVQAVKAMNLRPSVAWQLLGLVWVLGFFLGRLIAFLAGTTELVQGEMAPSLLNNPQFLAIIQGLLLILMVLGVHWVGRAFGGQGRFADAIAIIALLQFSLTVLRIAEVFILLVLPGLTIGVFLFNIFVLFYLLTIFVSELHGFTKPPLVLLGIFMTLFGLAICMSILLAMIGVSITEGIPHV